MSAVIDKLSAVAFRLQTFRDTIYLGTATGFLYRTPAEIFLITNYHVLSGYNPLTGQPLHSQGALPNRVEFHVPTVQLDENGVLLAFNYHKLSYLLLRDDGSPGWLVHPTSRERVDVAALPLGPEAATKVWTINDACASKEFDDFLLRPGQDVFVIGFPLGLGVAKHLALWKRGTIASEPMYDVDGKPIVLIDTATRSSMSGSPVIVQVNGTWMPRGSSALEKRRIGTGRSFLGVYSSRLGQDEFLAQLGVVWKARVIEEIIAQGQTLDVMTATEAVPARADVEAGEETNPNE